MIEEQCIIGPSKPTLNPAAWIAINPKAFANSVFGSNCWKKATPDKIVLSSGIPLPWAAGLINPQIAVLINASIIPVIIHMAICFSKRSIDEMNWILAPKHTEAITSIRMPTRQLRKDIRTIHIHNFAFRYSASLLSRSWKGNREVTSSLYFSNLSASLSSHSSILSQKSVML